MPRTKISKNAKRNRDTHKEERVREVHSRMEQLLSELDWKVKEDIEGIDFEIKMIKERLPQKMLSMKMGDLMKLNVKTIEEFNEHANTTKSDNTSRLLPNLSSIRSSTGKKSRDDEGYLTEDSTCTTGGIIAYTSSLAMPNRGRTPGPLSSAKAKSRRSRSAIDIVGSAMKPRNTNTTADHASRSKMRTPNPRSKALSVDRIQNTPKGIPESPTALLRWPKPGETVISISGSPVVSNFAPEKYANVNIPIRNGVLSLRPKKMQTVDPDIIEKIDAETIRQIKMLQSNLNVIMSFADKYT